MPLRAIRTPGNRATRPCPCGWRLSALRDCRCDEGAVARYQHRLSGPLLDRIDLRLSVPAVPWRELGGAPAGPTTEEVRAEVTAARERQAFRLKRFGARTNAEIPPGPLEAAVAATPEARALLGRAVDRLALTARGAHHVLRVARTVADLADAPRVGPEALAEALDYRGEEA